MTGLRTAACVAVSLWSALSVAMSFTVIGCDADGGTAPQVTSAGGTPTEPLASANPAGPREPVAARDGVAERPYNVLFLTVDSMRADMPWNGYARAIAPNLTKLASESAVYTRAYSASSYTAKSVGTMLTGRYPSSLYRGSSFFTEYAPSNVFFSEILQAAGVRTMAGHAHLYFDRGKKLEQGFDVWKMVPGLKWNATTDESVTSVKLSDLAIELLSAEGNTRGPFFMWLHYMDPHDQYLQHKDTPKFGRSARDRYDSEIHFTDRELGRLLAFCEKQKFWGRTAIVVSADHGEAFGEHGMYKHAFALWEVLTRVPLIVKIPGAEARRIDARRSHIDLAPTFVELLGVPAPASFVGKSLVSEVTGRTPAENREPIVLDLPADSNNPPTRALIFGDHKLIVDVAGGSYRLYDLAADPDETNNLAGSPKHRDPLAAMRKRYEETWAKIPEIAPFGGGKLVGGGVANGPRAPS
ncbi:MAG: choline-sulfatase [Myxococcales bacterium]|nr:choline-sulfatase [Myxococcales bacterium]